MYQEPAPELVSSSFSISERSPLIWATDIIGEFGLKLDEKIRVIAVVEIRQPQFFDGLCQRFTDKAAAETAKETLCVGLGVIQCHIAAFASTMDARIDCKRLICCPLALKLSGCNHCISAILISGQSWSMMENQAVSRLRPLYIIA